MFKVRQRNHILGMIFRRNAQPAIGRERYMKYAGDAMQRNAVNHYRARRVDHGNLRLRSRAIVPIAPHPRRVRIT